MEGSESNGVVNSHLCFSLWSSATELGALDGVIALPRFLLLLHGFLFQCCFTDFVLRFLGLIQY